MSVDFDPATLPWTDRESFPDALREAVAAGRCAAEFDRQLGDWRANGYLYLPGIVEHDLIDRLVADYERAWRTRPPVKVLVEGLGVIDLADAPARESLNHHHYRFMDFQEVSVAARRIMLHPAIVEAITLIFDAPPVAMQSLYFEYGSEQHIHQDYPFVQSQILSHLVGCWVACEDVTPDNGPLFYLPGSHRRPKFDFGGGSLVYDNADEARLAEFEVYLATDACADIEPTTFYASKGDVFVWHAALCHGGTPAVDRARTRHSMVSHYSTRAAYPVDRRSPDATPHVHAANGGFLYLQQDDAEPGALARLRSAVGRLRARR